MIYEEDIEIPAWVTKPISYHFNKYKMKFKGWDEYNDIANGDYDCNYTFCKDVLYDGMPCFTNPLATKGMMREIKVVHDIGMYCCRTCYYKDLELQTDKAVHEDLDTIKRNLDL